MTLLQGTIRAIFVFDTKYYFVLLQNPLLLSSLNFVQVVGVDYWPIQYSGQIDFIFCAIIIKCENFYQIKKNPWRSQSQSVKKGEEITLQKIRKKHICLVQCQVYMT